MADFKLSELAEKDLEGIAENTFREWGENQNRIYLEAFESQFQLLANQPGLVRKCDRLGHGLMRWEVGKHVAFFRRTEGGILILRVLHQSMLPDGLELEEPG